MPFLKLGLSPQIQRTLDKNGYIKPKPIQEKDIPLVLEKQDIMARAQTGSSKMCELCLTDIRSSFSKCT